MQRFLSSHILCFSLAITATFLLSINRAYNSTKTNTKWHFHPIHKKYSTKQAKSLLNILKFFRKVNNEVLIAGIIMIFRRHKKYIWVQKYNDSEAIQSWSILSTILFRPESDTCTREKIICFQLKSSELMIINHTHHMFHCIEEGRWEKSLWK